jgi:hypothetical protein
VPSDPDFPFEIAALECSLTVPAAFPAETPSLRVTNHEMGRGYQLNVETGFTSIVQSMPNNTLLQWLNALDQQLESLLSKEKAETVKIVVNQRKKEADIQPAPVSRTPVPARFTVVPVAISSTSAPTWTADEKQDAKSKRDLDTRQLEARLGRLPHFVKASDGLSYTLPIEPRRTSDLPIALQPIKTVKLIVPLLYNLQPCRIELQGVAGQEAEALQEAFRVRCMEHSGLSLVTHINYLSQNMHNMATVEPKIEEVPDVAAPKVDEQPVPAPEAKLTAEPDDGTARSHIITIPRPPEWGTIIGDHSSESEGTSFSDSEDDNNEGHEDVDEGHDDETELNEQRPETSQAQRGILMSFPNLEMHGIELLEVYSVSIEVKCERCKTQTDIQNVKNNVKLESAGARAESCRRCANSISVGTLSEIFAITVVFCCYVTYANPSEGYRMDLIHANSVKAGYLDLDGATIVDLLPR